MARSNELKEFISLPVTHTPRIAFYGPMCSGKTYAADHVPNAKKFSLATPIKRIAFEYYGVKGKTNEERQLLQQLGDKLKDFDQNVFTKYLLESIADFYGWHDYYYRERGEPTPPYRPIVVDDVRFNHEAEHLRKNGFILVEVRTPEHVRLQRIKEKYPDTAAEAFEHQSEHGWKMIKPDITIRGTGDHPIEFLIEQIYDTWK